MSNQNNQNNFITASQFNLKNVSFKEWSYENFFDKTFEYSQLITFPNYNYGTGSSKTPIFKINWTTFHFSAIPLLGSKYYEDDSKRNSIRYTFDPEQPECKCLEQALRQIDEYLISDTGRNLLLGSNKKMQLIKKRLKYQSIVVDPINNDDIEKDSDPNIEDDEQDDGPTDTIHDSQTIRLPYCKLRFALDEQKRYKTVFFLKKLNSAPGAQPQQINISNASELENYFSRGSEARFLVKMTKIWILKELRDNKYQYGAAFTILQMEIKEKQKNDFKNDFLQYSLGDDDVVPNIPNNNTSTNMDTINNVTNNLTNNNVTGNTNDTNDTNNNNANNSDDNNSGDSDNGNNNSTVIDIGNNNDNTSKIIIEDNN